MLESLSRSRAMILKLMIASALCGCVLAQQPAPLDCGGKPCVVRIRVSSGVTNAIADHKVLPDISDLKGRKLDSSVVVSIVVSKTGYVVHTRAVKGDPDLFTRSEEAAQKWHFTPYILNGQPIEVDTTIEFRYKKNKVKVFVPGQ
jgi:hypothetical protein